MQTGLAAHRALKGEVDLLERLARGEARGLDATLAAVTARLSTSVFSNTAANCA
jgi:hypothetical protein